MIIAEIGWNFLGDLKLAKKMIDQVSDAGCKFVKFQLWDPKTLKEGPWDNDGRREIYNKSFLDEEKYGELYNYSKSKKLNCFASIFNHSSIKTLLKFSNKLIKIPSLEAYDLELIRKSLDSFESVKETIENTLTQDLDRKEVDACLHIVSECLSTLSQLNGAINYEN